MFVSLIVVHWLLQNCASVVTQVTSRWLIFFLVASLREHRFDHPVVVALSLIFFRPINSRIEKQHVLATFGMDSQKSSRVRWMESIRGRILWTPLLRLSRQYYVASIRRDRQKRTEIWEFLLTIHRMPTCVTFHTSIINNITFRFIIISYNNYRLCFTNPSLMISSSVLIIFKF